MKSSEGPWVTQVCFFEGAMLTGVVADLAAFAAISGNTTLMGADKSDANEVGDGAVSIFEKINSSWVQTAGNRQRAIRC
jgi:hypothetical protein